MSRTLALCREIGYALGIGSCQQVLGRLAHAEGDAAEADRQLRAAADTLAAIGARFELGRTHLDLAALAHARGDDAGAAGHVDAAAALFRALDVPTYVERAAKLAREYAAGAGPAAAG